VYEYGNARVRAMRSRLLSRHAIESMIARKDLAYVISTLSQSDYAPDVAEALLRYSGPECVEEAARLSVIRAARAIRSFYEPPASDLVAVLLGRYDRHNLVACLRGVAARASVEETAGALFPAGVIREPLLLELAAQPDLRRAVDLMATWRLPYASAVSTALWRHGTDSTAPIERAIWQASVKASLDTLRGRGANVALVRELVEREVDVQNLCSLLRLAAVGLSPADVDAAGELISGGARLRPVFTASLGDVRGVEGLVSRLAGSPYYPWLEAAMPAYRQSGRVATLTRALETRLSAWCMALGRGDPLGIGVVIGYLAAKEAEVRNLRLIARLIWLEADRSAVYDELQSVGA